MSTSPDTPVLSFQDLEVGYGRNVVLHDINATINRGECVALTGNNGSGKSTLVKAIMGIDPFQRGTIQVFDHVRTAGHNAFGPKPWMRVGYGPQRRSAAPAVQTSVLEVVQAGLLGPGRFRSPRNWRALVLDALDKVGLAHRANEPFGILSGGQQQRALLARALVRSPELMILDEPLTGLDARNRQRLASLIAEGCAQGTTYLIVLHELGELDPHINREIRLSNGHIVHDGPCTHAHHEDPLDAWTHTTQTHVSKGGL